MIKKQYFLFSFCLIGIVAIAQPYNWTAVADSWSAAANWNNLDGAPYDYPQITHDVVILNNASPVTTDVDVMVKSVFLDNAGNTFGNMVIPSGPNPTAEEDFTILAGTYTHNNNNVFGIPTPVKVKNIPALREQSKGRITIRIILIIGARTLYLM